ncbi:unnamed protein product [Caenorhabditis sp. 36 PRJEB53466]|nr:unnamed protein product [Caenorhabditis sp. 36 PRJEB53466]
MSHFNPQSAFLANFGSPIPINRQKTIPIETEKYEGFFRSVYETLTNASSETQKVIHYLCEKDFVDVCKYYLKFRLDMIHLVAVGEKSKDSVNKKSLEVHSQMPRAISTIINSIGIVNCAQDTFTLVPVATGLSVISLSHNVREAYSRFVHHLKDHDKIVVEEFSYSPFGTPFWALNVREPCGNKLKAPRENVVVRASFSEWTGRDALLAAIMQVPLENDVLSPTEHLRFESPIIHNVFQMRKLFFHNGII